MKKVLLLLTIILISCGSEESTGAEETEVVEETVSEEVVEVSSETSIEGLPAEEH